MATLKEDAVMVAGIAIGFIVIAYYLKSKAGDALAAIPGVINNAIPYVDPTSDKNLAYQSANGLARWLTGQENGSLGEMAWDYANKAEQAPGAPAGVLINYTTEQQARDAAATKQLEAGFHGM